MFWFVVSVIWRLKKVRAGGPQLLRRPTRIAMVGGKVHQEYTFAVLLADGHRVALCSERPVERGGISQGGCAGFKDQRVLPELQRNLDGCARAEITQEPMPAQTQA